MSESLSVLEICAGAGGQSYGLEQAGFAHALAVEIDRDAAATLSANRPTWDVLASDVREVDGRQYRGVDLLAGGVPCPPFSAAGKQLGQADERDLFPEALRLVEEARPSAVMLENVRGLASNTFAGYRGHILSTLTRLGYRASWQLLLSSEYGVPQLRPRFILVAFQGDRIDSFRWPAPVGSPLLLSDAIGPMMAEHNWAGAPRWASIAKGIAPTVVGGSKKHGGADLGPTRAKQAWLKLGVDGKGISDSAPTSDHPVDHVPRLTNAMVARVQGFDSDWKFEGRKTSVYRQIGNAFPPPVARHVGNAVRTALGASAIADVSRTA